MRPKGSSSKKLRSDFCERREQKRFYSRCILLHLPLAALKHYVACKFHLCWSLKTALPASGHTSKGEQRD